MLLMLVDHAREFFYMHEQVSDPVVLSITSPELFFTRLSAHLCAPIFVALTGLAAWLYAQSREDEKAASEFLIKRGLFLVFLELTLVNFGWTFSFNPPTFFLQVIWAIGLSMIALSVLIKLPRKLVMAFGLAIICGHNLLDCISFQPEEFGYNIWAILHDRSFIELPWGARARTSYPVLPWIGVIALGYVMGPWFSKTTSQSLRGKKLLITGFVSIIAFLILRTGNLYGEASNWRMSESTTLTIMSYFNLTKYPPSLNFLLLTLGVGTLLLWSLEKAPKGLSRFLSVFGSAPLFFYLIHIYLLHVLNIVAISIWGTNKGEYFSVPSVAWLWGMSIVLAIPLWFCCRWFSSYKKKSGNPWLSYL